MSVHMKRPPTSDFIAVVVHDNPENTFVIPRKAASKLLTLLESLQVKKSQEELIPANEVFRDLDQKYGKVGATIRGFRSRDNMTQVQLAQKLAMRQGHVSEIEHGRRTIGKKLAQKLAKIFDTDYHLFL